MRTKAVWWLLQSVWFPADFSAHALYWRRFSVDVPANMSRCARAGCPVLVDFPGSGGSIYSQRAWTQWYAYQEQVDEPFILVTMEGSPDAIAPKETILTCTAKDSPEECMKISGGGQQPHLLERLLVLHTQPLSTFGFLQVKYFLDPQNAENNGPLPSTSVQRPLFCVLLRSRYSESSNCCFFGAQM